jgi:hypothetical protein
MFRPVDGYEDLHRFLSVHLVTSRKKAAATAWLAAAVDDLAMLRKFMSYFPGPLRTINAKNAFVNYYNEIKSLIQAD